jgi:hypothetical protein
MKNQKPNSEEKNRPGFPPPGAPSPMTKAKKSNGEEGDEGRGEEEDEEDEDEEGDGGEEDENEAEKGCTKSLSREDLEKSLSRLNELATEDDPAARKEVLLKKALIEELSKGEQEELHQILGGVTEPTSSRLSDDVRKGFGENETLQKALDVSDYLQENNNELLKSLDTLSKAIEASDSRQHEFNLVLAKAVSDIGRATMAMSSRLGVIEAQPARAPKSRGIHAPLEKGFQGSDRAPDGLSKSEILDALEEMAEDSINKGLGGVMEDGGDIALAISKYEQFNMISPSLLKTVQGHIQSRRASAH